jgi:hypothetical protein
MMNMCSVVTFIGARGIGKTFLSAIFCVIRCILWPGTKIVVASGVRNQAINVLEKILLELKPNSKELAMEIDDRQTKINGTNAQIVFKNGSFIKVVTATDSSRGSRANVLLIDEFRLVSKDVVDTVLRKFLTQRRMPRYSELSKKEREAEYAKEKNLTMYLSSAYWTDSWAYQKCKDTCQFMLDDTKRQFVCSLPYQLSLEEGLLDRELIEDEMAETDFSDVKFQMEYCGIFYGSAEGSFFSFDSISKNRKIQYPMLPERLASKLNNASQIIIPPKQNGEIRILSADIALMSSKKHNNDATAVHINCMMPTKSGRYVSNITYSETYEGLRTDSQALVIRKLYDEYMCDYLVIDSAGIGLGTVDMLMSDMSDPASGEIYPALSCCNNPEMADRCTVPGAPKVIWAIKASSAFNSDCAFSLREGFRSGRVRLLDNEFDAETSLAEIKGYNSLSPSDKVQLQMPYINTTLLVNELINLQHEEVSGKVKIFEKAGMRKDRYSSLAYNYYVALQIENKMNKKRAKNSDGKNMFEIKAPIYNKSGVIRSRNKKVTNGLW